MSKVCAFDLRYPQIEKVSGFDETARQGFGTCAVARVVGTARRIVVDREWIATAFDLNDRGHRRWRNAWSALRDESSESESLEHHGAPATVYGVAEHDVAIDQDIEEIARRHFERRRNLELSLGQLNARVADLLPDGPRDGLADTGRRIEACRLLRLTELGTRADDAQQQCRREDLVEVLVDVGPEPGVPGRVGSPPSRRRSILEPSGKSKRVQATRTRR